MSFHSERRDAILVRHPSVSKLCGHEWRSKYITVFLIILQLGAGIISSHLSWGGYLLLLYFVGGTVAQALFLAIHEMTHDLFFSSPLHNRIFSVMTNLPLVFPFSLHFRKYHLDHHRHLGKEGLDMDLPSIPEEKVFRGSVGKAFWCSFQIFAYALRPLLLRPLPLTFPLLLTWVIQICFDAFVVFFFGASCLRFLFASLVVAGGIHPCAGHFLTEHYDFGGGGETFSYYGPLNVLTWNVGYHVEHHDFPRVPWSRLPALRKEANEMYSSLPTSPPWSVAAFNYVFKSKMGLGRRVRRI